MRLDRNRIRLIAFQVAAVLLAIGVAAAVASSAPSGPQPTRVTTPFQVSGTVDGLLPGLSSQLRIEIRNTTGRSRIKVTSVTVTAGDAGPGCSGSQLRVGSFAGSLNVRAGRTKTISLPVKLASDAPDACQGATFPLQFGGRAVKP